MCHLLLLLCVLCGPEIVGHKPTYTYSYNQLYYLYSISLISIHRSIDTCRPVGFKDWIFFIDCDAFFTDFSHSIGDLLATHAGPMEQQPAGEAQFLVAEDPGGINTGVFLIRCSER